MKSGMIINKKKQSPQKKQFTQTLGLSQLNIENNKSMTMTQTIQPKKGHQIDNYQGPVHPVSRLRHGVGTYRFSNKFFTYTGNYNQGVKQGEGTFKLNDGTVIKGTFHNNQLTGQAQITYPDGSTYKGTLKNGQKSGYGIYKSKLQTYQGNYLQNKRHGQGTYKNSTTKITGKFENNKAHGQNIEIIKYNYQYRGQCANGLKNGKGIQISTYLDQNYKYQGQFVDDKFQGNGKYVKNGKIGYLYEGIFAKGLPTLYPNQFKVLLGTSIGVQSAKPSIQTFANISIQQNFATPIEYQLQTQNQLYFLIETCYQGPEQLDPNQPTQQQIQKMIKDWQAQNKKNKNPPPMPDFRQPRKIKPGLVLVQQESSRPIQIKIIKIEGGNETGQFMKIDYRQSIKQKRAQNQVSKAQAAKKAQQEGNKKGGKGGAKAQVQLKVNAFVEKPTQKQKTLTITNEKGKAEIQKIQFPDDFPVGTFQLIISSPFNLFGRIKQFKKVINVKAKNAGGKKK